MSKGIYVGKLSDVPIYETTEEFINIAFHADNIDDIFYSTTSATAFVKSSSSEGIITFGNTTGSTSFAGISYQETITVLYPINNVEIYAYKSGQTSPQLTINSEIISETGSSSGTLVWSGNLVAGDVISMTGRYTNYFMTTYGYFAIHADNISTSKITQTIVGYEQKEVARKVKKLYTGMLTENMPVYETTIIDEAVTFDASSINQNFEVTNDISEMLYSDWDENNIEIFAYTSGDKAQATYKLKTNLTNAKFYYKGPEAGMGYLIINGTTIQVTEVEGANMLTQVWSGSLSIGDEFTVCTGAFKDISFFLEVESSTIPTETKEVVGYETKEVARKIVKGYIGARAPIYETTTVETAIPFEYTNMDKIFSYSTLENELVISDGEYGIKFSPEPNVTSNQVFTDTYTLLTDLTNVRIYCNLRNVDADQGESWVEINGDYFDNTQDGLLGTISSLSAGSTIEVAIYHKTSGDYSTFEIVADDPITTKEVQIITGYEDKVTARLFYMNLSMNYDGTNSVEEITIDGVPYDLYTITDSGTLILNEATQYWACAGGGGGGVVSSNLKEASGGGGGGYFSQGILEPGTYTIAIGAGGASATTGAGTTITPIENNTVGNIISIAGGNSSTTRDGGDGGSGGGAGGYRAGNFTYEGAGGTGSGSSTYPFGLESLKAHCAGGGGGSYYSAQNACTNGGDGGSNGGNGEDGVDSYLTTSGSIGGEYGGGNGGKHGVDGSNGTFYGAGGGAGGMDKASSIYGTSGTGYQGVMYLLVPA